MKSLQDIMHELSGDEAKQLVTTLDRIVAVYNLNHLNPEKRCQFIYGLVNLPIDTISALTSLNQDAKNKLRYLRNTGLNSFARVAAVLFETIIESKTVQFFSYTPLTNGPVVILVANMGAQVPTPNPTLGYHLRKRRGLVPPFGLYYLASFLELLGVETHVFNLALGEREYNELEETITLLKERLYFVSFGSNFLGESELNAVYYLSDILNKFQDEGL